MRPEENPVLEALEISRSFGPVAALKRASLTLRPGEVHALLGENGAGKSTLLKILGGQQSPDSGRILLHGRELRLTSPDAAHRAGIRVVAQEPEILPHVSVAENILIGDLPHHAHRFSRRGLRQVATEHIEQWGLQGILNAGAMGDSLSPAQRQVVEILRALRTGLQVIAFDEPTSSLSDKESDALFALIRGLRSEGVAVLYVSHRMHEVMALADRMTVLRDGTLVGSRASAETSETELIRMMVGRDLTAMFTRERGTPGRDVLVAKGLQNEHLDNVNLTLRSGEVVVLAGLVGAGRTELAKALVGDDVLDAGAVEIEGKRVRLRSPRDAVRAGIGLAPEERKAEALLMDRSVRDNASIASLSTVTTMHVVSRVKERALVDRLLADLRVRTSSMSAPVSTLSGGNQQKVVLARWLARNPKVLILDEPTRGVDVGAKADIYKIIGEQAAHGMAILVISSEMVEVLGIADRILVMSGGRIVGELDGRSATEEDVVKLALNPVRETMQEVN